MAGGEVVPAIGKVWEAVLLPGGAGASALPVPVWGQPGVLWGMAVA